MESQPGPSHTGYAAPESLSNSAKISEPESLVPVDATIPFHELITHSMNIVHQIDDPFGGVGPSNSSHLHFSGNDPMLSLSTYDQNQIEPQIENPTMSLQVDSIATSPSFGVNLNYIALPSAYSLVGIPLDSLPSVTVKYYFPPYSIGDLSNLSNVSEWTHYDQNGFRVDNLILDNPKDKTFDLTNLDKFHLEPSTSSGPASSSNLAQETVIPYPDQGYSSTMFNVEQPPVSPQVISNDPSIQLEQSNTEPSNLVVNKLPMNAAQMPDPDTNQMEPPYGKFPEKLWSLTSDAHFQQLSWSPDGRSIEFEPKLLEPVLKKFHLSPKMDTFIRQLHHYGFRKTNRLLPKRGLPEVCKYKHQLFQQDHPELVKQIKRPKINPIQEQIKVVDPSQSGLFE